MSLKAEKYIDDTGFEDYTVIKSASLNYLDPVGNSNKFYTAEVHENNGKYRVFTHYGRLGKAGTKDVRFTDNLNVAIWEFESLIRKKTSKGYTEIQLAQSATGSDKGTKMLNKDNVLVAKTIDGKASTLEPLLQKLIRHLYMEAGHHFSQLVEGEFATEDSSPLGKLSVQQIEKGRKVLSDIAYVLHKPNFADTRMLNALSREYYLHIPKVFGNKIKLEDVLISDSERLQQELEILTFYEDILRMGSVIYETDNIDSQYAALNSDIGILDPQSDKYKQLVDYVNSTQSKHHYVHLEVQNIYTVNQKNAPEFDDSYGNVKELFHGSRSANLVGILSSNLKMPLTLQGVQITGAMFGPGIYFADQSTKSSQYAIARFGGNANKSDTAYLFVSEVALGRIHEVERSHYFLNPPEGFDSVKGVMGSSLLHNEYIIYKENQQRIRYLIEFVPKNR